MESSKRILCKTCKPTVVRNVREWFYKVAWSPKTWNEVTLNNLEMNCLIEN